MATAATLYSCVPVDAPIRIPEIQASAPTVNILDRNNVSVSVGLNGSPPAGETLRIAHVHGLTEIMAKLLLLAEDKKIKAPSIPEQLR